MKHMKKTIHGEKVRVIKNPRPRMRITHADGSRYFIDQNGSWHRLPELEKKIKQKTG